jgi:hypothetical protein
MKKNFLFCLTLLGSVIVLSASAQVKDPVSWTFTSKKINATTYEVHMTATVEGGWKIFAQEPGSGPSPTSIKLTKNQLATPMGKVMEVGKPKRSHDPSFNSDVKYYLNQVDFVQKVNVKGKTAVKGRVEWMVADEKEALPPKARDFSVTVG